MIKDRGIIYKNIEGDDNIVLMFKDGELIKIKDYDEIKFKVLNTCSKENRLIEINTLPYTDFETKYNAVIKNSYGELIFICNNKNYYTYNAYDEKNNAIIFRDIDGNYIVFNFDNSDHLRDILLCYHDDICINKLSINKVYINNDQNYSPDKFDFEIMNSFRLNNFDIINALQLYDIKIKQDDNCTNVLTQKRGFCYYHAVLHALLIPDNMRKLCCKKLFEYLEDSPVDFNIENFTNIDICEYINADNKKYYVMKFIYQTLFHYNHIKDKINNNNLHPVEVIIAITQKYKNDLNNMPEGGSTFLTAIELLNNIIDIGFYILSDVIYINKTVDTIKDAQRELKDLYSNIDYEKDGISNAEMDEDELNALGNNKILYEPDCLVYYMPNFAYDPNFNIIEKMKVLYDITNYTLEFAFIAIIYKSGSGHAVTGVICNKVPLIIDSNMSYPIEFDWINDNLYNAKMYYNDIESIEIQYVFVKKQNYSCDELEAKYFSRSRANLQTRMQAPVYVFVNSPSI